MRLAGGHLQKTKGWLMKVRMVAAALALVTSVATGGTLSPADPSAVRRHQGIASVAVSQKNGRQWATWYASPTPGEDKNTYQVLATCAAGDRKWREVLVYDPDGPGPERAFDGQVWVAPDGRLRWTFTQRTTDGKPFDETKRYAGHEGYPETDRLLMVELDAENEPTPVDLPTPRIIGKGVMMGKPIVLSDGAWLFPAAHWGAAPSSVFYATRDGGRTFSMRGGVTIPEAARLYDEQVVVERKDGDLLTFIRTHWNYPHPLESVSHDGGRTWEAPVKARFANASARVCLRRLRSGNWLFVKNGAMDEKCGRKRLMAFLSKDEGRTWSTGLMLDERETSTYPDADETPDGLIVVCYDRDRFVRQEILLARFTEADLEAGHDVSGRFGRCVIAQAAKEYVSEKQEERSK